MTPEQLADTVARHHPEPTPGAGGPTPPAGGRPPQRCAECSGEFHDVDWPCDVERIMWHFGVKPRLERS